MKRINIYCSNGYFTINRPIIKDAILLSNNKNSIKYTDKNDFDNGINELKLFSGSYSHCYKNENDYDNNIMDDNSIMLFETGHELKAVWDNTNNIGYIKF